MTTSYLMIEMYLPRSLWEELYKAEKKSCIWISPSMQEAIDSAKRSNPEAFL